LSLVFRLFDFQQKHSRLHSKIKEVKIKAGKCLCDCHMSKYNLLNGFQQFLS
jgi:hypothetical protein